MPKREMKPAKKADQEKKERAARDRQKFLEQTAKVRHVLALDEKIGKTEVELGRTNFQLAILIDLLDRRRSIFGRKTLPRKLLNKVLKKKFQEIKAQIEAAEKAKTEKEETQPARKES
jgi:hypothetical protein